MHNLSSSIEKELQTFRISFKDEAQVSKTFDHIDGLIQYAQARTGAETTRVAASMWFRRYAFFVTAQFYMISKHRLTWNGTLQDIGVLDDPEDKNWLPNFWLKNLKYSLRIDSGYRVNLSGSMPVWQVAGTRSIAAMAISRIWHGWGVTPTDHSLLAAKNPTPGDCST